MKNALLVSLLFLNAACGISVVDPGTRGIKVTMGSVEPRIYSEGTVFHWPLVASITQISIKQTTSEISATCYSSDLQQVNMRLKVLYRIPSESVLDVFLKYSGNPLESIIAPRVQEAMKEVTALDTAEAIVKKRELIKNEALKIARLKIGTIVFVEDLVIENIDLSKDLENAIESKMVQQQEAAKAEYTKQKARIEAETAIIKAKGEAEAINVRGKAIKDNPGLVNLQIAEKWDGVAPLVVGSGNGSNVLLPINNK